MRKFNQKEQSILRKLIQTDFNETNVLNFISNNVLNNRLINFIHSEKTIKLIFRIEDKNAANEILETIFLINYLEKNDLVVLHSSHKISFNDIENTISKNITQENIKENPNAYFSQNIQTSIYDLLSRYTFSYFFVSEELKELIKNNFETIEDFRHKKEFAEAKKQTKLSQLSFILALVALIISILTAK